MERITSGPATPRWKARLACEGCRGSAFSGLEARGGSVEVPFASSAHASHVLDAATERSAKKTDLAHGGCGPYARRSITDTSDPHSSATALSVSNGANCKLENRSRTPACAARHIPIISLSFHGAVFSSLAGARRGLGESPAETTRATSMQDSEARVGALLKGLPRKHISRLST